MCYRGHIACLPPSTASVAPVMKDASLEARKAITFATSSAFPGRPKACVSFERSKNCAKKNRYRVKVNQRQKTENYFVISEIRLFHGVYIEGGTAIAFPSCSVSKQGGIG